MKYKKIIAIVVIVLLIILSFLVSLLYNELRSLSDDNIIDTSKINNISKKESITILKSTFKYDDSISFQINVSNEKNYIVIVPSYIPLDNFSFMKKESINTWKNAQSGKYDIYIDDRFSNGEYEIRLIENNEVIIAKKIYIDSEAGHESPTLLESSTNYVSNESAKLTGLSLKFKHDNNILENHILVRIRIDNDIWLQYPSFKEFSLNEDNYATFSLFDFSKMSINEFINHDNEMYEILKKYLSIDQNNYYIDISVHTIEISLSYDGIKYSVPLYLSK